MQIQNILTFRFKSSEDAAIFYNSFIPELDTLPMKRSKWEISSPMPNSSEIKFEIESEDVTAFRATMNSLIQFVHICERTLELIE